MHASSVTFCYTNIPLYSGPLKDVNAFVIETADTGDLVQLFRVQRGGIGVNIATFASFFVSPSHIYIYTIARESI